MPRRFPPVVLCAALLVSGLGLAACAGAPPVVPPPVDVRADPYGAFPPSPDPAPAPRPESARLTADRRYLDPELFRFLDRLTSAVERQAWDAVALFLEEDALAEQLVLLADGGLSGRRAAADALASALGLDFAEAPLVPEGFDRDAAPFLALDRLRTMTVQRVEEDAEFGGRWLVAGYVRLDDRSTREYTLHVRPTPRGLRVVVPRG